MSLPCKSLQSPLGSTRQQSAGTSARFGVAQLCVSTHRCPQVRATRTEPVPPVAAGKSSSSTGKGPEESIDWTRQGVPVYLQSSVDIDVCDEESQALTMGMAGDLLWNAIRAEAQADAATEPLLSSFLYASILAHDSFELALGFVLANRLANSTMLPTQLFEIFHGVLRTDAEVRCAALSDIAACRERDPACTSYSHALLYYKGYHAIQTQRIAHALWRRNQKVMALAMQSRMSEVFAVDIHPAARIGKGVLLDHGTGVVIGETAIIGNNVSILQNVTLGGTGKEIGDRHPKVGDNVLIGACATILGNIHIGKGAQIAAGSLVLKPVPPHILVAGSPAKEIGPVLGNPALSMRHWSRRLMEPEGAAGVAAAGAAVTVASGDAVAVAASAGTGTVEDVGERAGLEARAAAEAAAVATAAAVAAAAAAAALNGNGVHGSDGAGVSGVRGEADTQPAPAAVGTGAASNSTLGPGTTVQPTAAVAAAQPPAATAVESPVPAAAQSQPQPQSSGKSPQAASSPGGRSAAGKRLPEGRKKPPPEYEI